MRPLRPGDPRSVGAYELTGFLGEGGQGSVYLGGSPAGGQVAIKLLHARFADDPQAVRRFLREAEAARRVAEFCTASVLEVGAADDRPFIVTEYVAGPSLQHQVSAEGPLAEQPLLRLAVATATALGAIHRAGVMHRDFKPSNVLLGPDGPRVIDFGIARAMDVSQSLTTSVVGTPAYMAPEQFHGDPSPASDVFAWAGTMVYAATGRAAFGFGALPQVMHRILTGEPDLAGVPGSLAPLLRAALAKDSRARPTAEQLLTELLRPVSASPAGTDAPGLGGAAAGDRRSGPPPPGHYGSGPHAMPAPGTPSAKPPPYGDVPPPGAAQYGGNPARPFPSPGGRPTPTPASGAAPHGSDPVRPFPSAGPQVEGSVAPYQVVTRPGAAGRAGRRVVVSAAAVATALIVGLAAWLVVRGQEPGGVETAASPRASGMNAAVTGVANPSDATGGTVRAASAFMIDSTDPGDMYMPDMMNVVRLYGRSLTMFKPAPGAEGTRIVPDLAESLGEPSDGGRTWTYRLRRGLKFQDGKPITAADVKHAVLRSMDPRLSSGPMHFPLLLDLPSGYEGPHEDPDADTDRAIETPDEHTIIFKLKEPYGAFDFLAQLPATIPVPRAADTVEKYRYSVVSSGPYQFAAPATDDKLVLEHNPHWDPATDPNRTRLPDGFELEFGGDSATAQQRLLSGAVELGPALTDGRAAHALAGGDVTSRADAPVTGPVDYLAINPEVEPFDDVDCRRAVVRALDLVALREAAYGKGPGAGAVPTSLLPPVIPGTHPPVPGLTRIGDPAGAKRDLAACGEDDGFATTYVYRELPGAAKTAEAVRAALAEVGIQVSLRGFPVTEFHTEYGGNPAWLKKEGAGLIAKAWAADWPDPGSFLRPLVDRRLILEEGSSVNVNVRLSDLDPLIDQATREVDGAARAALWERVERRVAEEALVVPLVWRTSLLLRGPKVTNAHVSPAYGNYDLVTLGVR